MATINYYPKPRQRYILDGVKGYCPEGGCEYKTTDPAIINCPHCGTHLKEVPKKPKFISEITQDFDALPTTKPNGEYMKLKNALTLINAAITTITVHYVATDNYDNVGKGDQAYTFKITKDAAKDLKIGDLLLVEGRTEKSFAVVRLVEVHEESEIDPDSDINYKWVVGKIDIDGLNATKAAEEAALKDLKSKQRAHYREDVRKKLEGGLLTLSEKKYDSETDNYL